MAFNPNNYKAPVAKPLPVVLLLDVSGSMAGEKINSLYDAVTEMIKTFDAEAVKETIINVAIITFGMEITLHTPYTPVSKLASEGINRFSANGMTPMGVALTMAKDMIEDKDTTSGKSYRPAVVLVSDGWPNDDWATPLDNFINDGRSKKCQRFSVAIGDGADKDLLRKFADDDSMFTAETAGDIASKFRKITMSVSMRSRSTNPNMIQKIVVKDNDSDEDDDF
ncbi:MAG: VWA domain-containing protein [Ruminococcus sp.]|nr:VWA domain-containing protein [Ruminococcus sp.]